MKFVACLNCIDGRVQLPVISWIKQNYDIDYVDMITEPGIDKLLIEKEIAHILEKVNISINNHESSHIFITGHFDCAGNPVDSNKHKNFVSLAVDEMKKRYPTLNIVGVWVNETWEVEKIIER